MPTPLGCDRSAFPWPIRRQLTENPPENSLLASAVVMVPKKNNARMRFCVNYRPLNKVTRKDNYPLPRIDESLDLVAGSSWFSTLDLWSGYW